MRIMRPESRSIWSRAAFSSAGLDVRDSGGSCRDSPGARSSAYAVRGRRHRRSDGSLPAPRGLPRPKLSSRASIALMLAVSVSTSVGAGTEIDPAGEVFGPADLTGRLAAVAPSGLSAQSGEPPAERGDQQDPGQSEQQQPVPEFVDAGPGVAQVDTRSRSGFPGRPSRASERYSLPPTLQRAQTRARPGPAGPSGASTPRTASPSTISRTYSPCGRSDRRARTGLRRHRVAPAAPTGEARPGAEGPGQFELRARFQAVVDALTLTVGERRERTDADQQQHGRDRQLSPRARPCRAGCRTPVPRLTALSTKPTPRTVWISFGPPAASILRRR